MGLLGADFTAAKGRWRIERIYTFENWNPSMAAPLDRPGLKIEVGHYLVGVDGMELTAADDPLPTARWNCRSAGRAARQ